MTLQLQALSMLAHLLLCILPGGLFHLVPDLLIELSVGQGGHLRPDGVEPDGVEENILCLLVGADLLHYAASHVNRDFENSQK